MNPLTTQSHVLLLAIYHQSLTGWFIPLRDKSGAKSFICTSCLSFRFRTPPLITQIHNTHNQRCTNTFSTHTHTHTLLTHCTVMHRVFDKWFLPVSTGPTDRNNKQDNCGKVTTMTDIRKLSLLVRKERKKKPQSQSEEDNCEHYCRLMQGVWFSVSISFQVFMNVGFAKLTWWHFDWNCIPSIKQPQF